MQRRNVLTALGGSMLLGRLVPAWAQGYPNQAIKVVVPYAAGGGADAVARLLGRGMSEELKQSVIVDNKGGAGGMVGAEFVSKSKADGYTILFAGNPELTITPWLQKASYSPLTDFTPVVLVSQSPNVLVANASLGAKTMRNALEAARKLPGGITIATPGTGTPQHIAVELLRAQTKLDITHVPYKGASPATVAVLSGEVSFALVGAPPLLPHLSAGKLVPLAVTQPKRSPLLAHVPTVGEAMGIMRDDDLVAWYGVLVPSHTPPEVVAQLEKAASVYLKQSDTRAKFAALGTDLVDMPSAAFGQRMRTESAQYGEIVKRFGIKSD